jgi:hypothetical protein
MREPTDWEVIEYTCEVLADIRQRLKAGAAGPGATLDADECVKVLACLADPPFPNHTPADNTLRDAAIVQHFWICRRTMKRMQAVAATAKHFQETRWVVNEALRAQKRRREMLEK